MNLITRNSPYYPLLKYLLFLLKHPVYIHIYIYIYIYTQTHTHTHTKSPQKNTIFRNIFTNVTPKATRPVVGLLYLFTNKKYSRLFTIFKRHALHIHINWTVCQYVVRARSQKVGFSR